jgi:hypothetical protein
MKNCLLAMTAGAALLLGGCASYVTTNVTAFQDWRGSDAERTFAYSRDAQQSNSIEQRQYEQLVTDALTPYGFRLTDEARARYAVSLAYGVENRTTVVSQPMVTDPFLYSGGYWGGRRGGAWGAWSLSPAAYIDQPVPYYIYGLSIRIVERESGREVYMVSASNAGQNDALVRAMPYLVRSALADFPYANGTVTRVRLPAGDRQPVGEFAAPAAGAAAGAPASAATAR